MFTKGQAIDFIEKAFGSATLTNGGLNASVVCPKCAEKVDNLQKRKLVIRTDDFLCHCWVCDYRAPNLIRLLRDHKPHLIEEYREKFDIRSTGTEYQKCFVFNIKDLVNEASESPEPATKVILPTGFTLIATNRGKGIRAVEDAWKYLQSRGLTEQDLWLWKFGVTDYRPALDSVEPNCRFRVIVPSFDADGNLNYFSARAYWDKLKGAKYTNPEVPREGVIFNEINLDWSKELTLVEGVFDLVKCNENATCVLGSTLGKEYKLFQKIAISHTPVLLAFDPDAKKKTYKVAKLLHGYGVDVRIFEVPAKFKDVGEMTKEEFIAAIPDAKPFHIGDYLRYCLDAI